MNPDELLALAISSRTAAYAPYSHFAVGAALETRSGRVFTGCNVENLSFGLTICAERSAVFAAVAAGERDFSQIVIVADSQEPVSPCGGCRQVLLKTPHYNNGSGRLSCSLVFGGVGVDHACDLAARRRQDTRDASSWSLDRADDLCPQLVE